MRENHKSISLSLSLLRFPSFLQPSCWAALGLPPDLLPTQEMMGRPLEITPPPQPPRPISQLPAELQITSRQPFNNAFPLSCFCYRTSSSEKKAQTTKFLKHETPELRTKIMLERAKKSMQAFRRPLLSLC